MLLRLLITATLLIATTVANAQHRDHRCWDIDLLPENYEERHLLLPYSLLHVTEAPMPTDSGAMLVEMGKEYLGTPYRYGGKTPKGFDCAGFARFLYHHFGYTLAPYSGGQYKQGRKVETHELRAGDLVFFGGRRNSKSVGHTGIVVDADTARGTFRFIHSSTSSGVIISRSTEEYYAKRYIGARRVFQE